MTADHDIPYRRLGRTDERVSAIGLGGYHLGSEDLSDSAAVKIIRSAIDRGITFLDNSWDYHEGVSEKRMGKALRDGYRDRAFLMTKVDGRSRKEAERQLNESLKRLGVETIDLVQHHEVIRYEDPHRMFDKDGANAALVDARAAGKLRYIGFTGHKDPHIHLHTLAVARDNGFRFDTVQMPLNVMDAHYRSFERLVLPALVKDDIGVLGMKSMGAGTILKSGTVTATECLHYALALPTSVVITGIEIDGAAGTGDRGGAHVPSNDRGGTGPAEREDLVRRGAWCLRAVQDLLDPRLHRRTSRVAGRRDAAVVSCYQLPAESSGLFGELEAGNWKLA